MRPQPGGFNHFVDVATGVGVMPLHELAGDIGGFTGPGATHTPRAPTAPWRPAPSSLSRGTRPSARSHTS
jgi:hypothetical protein